MLVIWALGLFLRKDQIYYIDSPEVHGTSNIIKIISRSLDHRTIIAAIRTSRRRATVAAPILEPADLVDNSREVFVHVL